MSKDTGNGEPSKRKRRQSLGVTTISAPYKVLGDLSDPDDGIGVLGRNTATSGITRGIEGRVDSPNGYGLYTPDDAGIEGTVVTSTVESPASTTLTLNTDGGTRAMALGVPQTDARSDTAGANVVAGHPNNSASTAVGATVGGGGSSGSQTVDGSSRANTNEVSGNYGTVAGGLNNRASGLEAVVGGGEQNTASAENATVAGGDDNTASGLVATVGGGLANTANDRSASVGGGEFNTAFARFTTIAGGGPVDSENPLDTNNVVHDRYGTIGGGGNNQAGTDDSDSTNARFATVGGGNANTASGHAATVPGGSNNTADGKYSFAAGRGADTNGNNGAFVVGDASDTPVAALNDNEVVFQAPGGFVITGGLTAGSDHNVNIDSTTGELLDATASSERYKTNIESLATDTSSVLDLEPRTFEYEEIGESGVGFIAEEVEETFPDLVLYDEAGRPDGVNYNRLGVFLLPEIRAQRDRLNDLEKTVERTARCNEAAEAKRRDTHIAALEAENDALRNDVTELKAQVKRKNERIATVEHRLSALEDQVAGLAREAGGSAAPADD